MEDETRKVLNRLFDKIGSLYSEKHRTEISITNISSAYDAGKINGNLEAYNEVRDLILKELFIHEK